jgi:NADH-quinone oxidoreductase subunit D
MNLQKAQRNWKGESDKGALGYFVVSGGGSTPKPYRLKISVGSLYNMLALLYLLVRQKLGVMPTT